MRRVYVPGVIVRPLVQPIEASRLGLRGRVVDVQVWERGVIVQRTGPFPNMILTQGLNQIATTLLADVFRYCAVGTGNTPPAAAQTGLVAEVARTSNYLTGAGNCGTTRVTPTKITMRRTFDFPVGSINANVAELGFSPSSSAGGNLFSRVLIQSGGVPVTVSVTSSQSLRVVYELEVNLPSSAQSFNLNFGGAWGVVTGNMAVQDTATLGNSGRVMSSVLTGGNSDSVSIGDGALEPSANSTYVYLSDSAAALQPVGSATSRYGTTIQYKTGALAAYTAGAFYRDLSVTFATTEGNIANTRSIFLGGTNIGQGFAALFDTARSKANTQTLTLTFRRSWAAL